MTAQFMKRGTWLFAILFLATVRLWAAETYSVTGLLLKIDPAHQTMVVSCEDIPGYMDAMVMAFTVRDPKMPAGLAPGMTIEFTLIVDKNSSYAENVRARPFQSLELDPTQARRLKLMENLLSSNSPATTPLAIGQPVPDFTLTDQNRRRVTLSQLGGKVVAITFIYTRCPLPTYCVRLSNNFGLLQKRFKSNMGRDLVLLSIVIDPVHDQPEVLANYARIWKADPNAWHFLTGPLTDIQQLSHKFDMNFYPEEALLVHSFHTVVIDRQGKLAANLEGNAFTGEQLGDLVETMLTPAERDETGRTTTEPRRERR